MNNKKFQIPLRRDWFKQFGTMLIGFDTSLATYKIIKEFKPKHWVIENPQTSKIWDTFQYMTKLEGFKNKAYYNAYDDMYSKKPTIFFSDKKLNLLTTSKPSTVIFNRIASYNQRSMIPSQLLIQILQELTKEDKKY